MNMLCLLLMLPFSRYILTMVMLCLLLLLQFGRLSLFHLRWWMLGSWMRHRMTQQYALVHQPALVSLVPATAAIMAPVLLAATSTPVAGDTASSTVAATAGPDIHLCFLRWLLLQTHECLPVHIHRMGFIKVTTVVDAKIALSGR